MKTTIKARATAASALLAAVLAQALLGACVPGGDPNEVVSISVAPASISLEAGQTAALTVTAQMGDYSERALSAGVSWTSTAPAVAGAAGLTLTALKGGAATITASYAGKAAPLSVTVTEPVYLERFDGVQPDAATFGFFSSLGDNSAAGGTATFAAGQGSGGSGCASFSLKAAQYHGAYFNLGAPVDASAFGKLSFLYKGNAAAKSINVQLKDSGGAWISSAKITAAAADWTEFSVPLASFSLKGYPDTNPATKLDLAAVRTFQFQADDASTDTVFMIDDLRLSGGAGPADGWTLVWQDEFSGGSVDGAKWAFETGTGPNGDGWGNLEKEYYQAANATIGSISDPGSADGKALSIAAKAETVGGMPYTSARIKTQGKFSVQYGKIEARIKVPDAKGLWPAFWMLGDSIATDGWPACGEIDVLEVRCGGAASAGMQDTAIGTYHFSNAADAWQYATNSTKLPGGALLSAGFHVYSVEWDAAAIVWKVDGTAYHWADLSPAYLSEFKAPFFIILNLAVSGKFFGGGYESYVPAAGDLPQSLQVDYVRVYKKAGT